MIGPIMLIKFHVFYAISNDIIQSTPRHGANEILTSPSIVLFYNLLAVYSSGPSLFTTDIGV